MSKYRALKPSGWEVGPKVSLPMSGQAVFDNIITILDDQIYNYNNLTDEYREGITPGETLEALRKYIIFLMSSETGLAMPPEETHDEEG